MLLRRRAIDRLNVTLVDIPDAKLGMSATLRRGAAEARALLLRHEDDDYECSGMMVLLPDMPDITTTDLVEMNNAFTSSGGTSVRASTADGNLGHPTIFSATTLRAFETLTGDKGAAQLFDQDTWIPCALPGNRARLDLDTPEDWDNWRKTNDLPS